MHRERIQIMIASRAPETSDYLRSVLKREPDMDVISVAMSKEELIHRMGKKVPDVVVVDVSSIASRGKETFQWLRDQIFSAKMVVINCVEDDVLVHAYEAGAAAVLSEKASIVDVVRSIREAFYYYAGMEPEVARRIVAQLLLLRQEQQNLFYAIYLVSVLTSSEFKVLRMVYEGYSYKDIAAQRHVEEVTVRSQTNRILGKVGEKNIKTFIQKLKTMQVFSYIKKL